MPQSLPFEVLHRDEVPPFVLIHVVDGADVWVIQRRGGLGLALEPLQCMAVPGHLFRQELQGDGALQLDIFGLVDDPHAAAAKLFQDLVVRNGGADHGDLLPERGPARTASKGMPKNEAIILRFRWENSQKECKEICLT